MKGKLILIGALIGLLVFMLFGCSNTPAPSVSTNVQSESITVHGMDLDAAIREVATQMETRISSGTMVALVSVASPSNAFSTQVLTRLESAIVSNGKLVVVDRANLDKVREEQGFQLSGEVDDASATSIGRLLGAGAIVTGSLADLGDVYSLAFKAINIETATVAVSYLADLTKTTRIETLLATRDAPATPRTQPVQITQHQQAPTPVAQAPTPAATVPPTSVYGIGDTGPAGGIIFYDKGNNSGGWRYLEAAPATTETSAQWRHNSGVLGEDMLRAIGNTSREMGMGHSNTQNIMRYFNQNGGGFGLAVQVCDELSVNGFNDWFLPSQDELSHMYGNLHRRGLGGFRNEWYYSSTIITGNFTLGYSPSRLNFANGEPGDGNSSERNRIRAVRRF